MRYRTITMAVAAALPLLAQSEEAVLPAVRATASTSQAAADYNPGVSSTATKGVAELRDIPQTVNVISNGLMKDQGARSMADALRNVPGVTLNLGDGQRDQFVIRGFSAIGDNFLDGVRDDALYYRDLSGIDRIEVIKGPAAVLYGRGSSGGIINRVSKLPTKRTVREVGVQVDSDGQRRATLDLGGTLVEGEHLFRLTGAVEDSKGFRDESFLKRSALAPSVDFKLGSDTRLLLQATHNRDKRPTDFGIPDLDGRPLHVPRETYYGSGESERDDATLSVMNTGTATLTHRIDDAWSLKNVLRYYDFKLDRKNTMYASGSKYTLENGQLMMSRNHATVRRDERGWFNQFELSQTLAAGAVRHNVLYGVEIARQDKTLNNVNWNGIDTVPLFNPGGKVPLYAGVEPTTRTIDNVTTVDNKALYVQDQMALGERWKALVGVRYDDFRQRTTAPRSVDLERTDREWSPRAGLVWQPTPAQSYYVSVSKSFQPSAEQFQLSKANDSNAPEMSTNYEVGAKWDLLDGALSAGASLFRLTRTDVKVADLARAGFSINAGEQRTDGLELSLSGTPAAGWQVHAGYAYLDGETLKSTASGSANFGTTQVKVPYEGRKLALTPRHSGSVWLTRALGSGWSAGGGVRAQASQYATPDNLVRLPGYAVVDLALLYRGTTYDLSFNLMNALDRMYWAAAHGSVNGFNQPGAPRSLQVGMNYRF
jgi:catecholate siderophore receptor